MKKHDFIDAAVKEIQMHGVTEWEVDMNHNHPRVVFAWNGRTISHVMPGSTVCYNAPANNISDLRRQMGVKRTIHKSKSAPKKRTKTFVALSTLPDSFTVRANPLLALAGVKDAIKAAGDEARFSGRFAFFSGLCGSPPCSYSDHMAKAFMLGWYDGVWGNSNL